MFDKSLRKSVQPFLDACEQPLGAVMAQNAGANAADSAGVKVDGIDLEPSGLAKAVTLRVRGTAIGTETARALERGKLGG